ncbi:MAG: putative lipopolysaccharide heptosyltransferase III [Simkaniaceae bacterium]|nr:putative lipopolysaccharide heptosyltransferase III [Simkaniaceae bacterium]
MGHHIDFKSLNRILVCKLRHHGDVLLTSPVFSNLKRAAPQANIDAYIYKETYPMLEGHPDIEGYLFYDKGWKKLSKWRRYCKEAQLLKEIRNKKYDMVINLTEGDRGAIAALFSGARYRVAFHPKGQGMWGKDKLYTHIVKECPMMRHTVEMNLDLLRGIGIFPEEEERELTFVIPSRAKVKMKAWIEKPYAVVHPVSRWMFKCTKEAIIAQVIRHLLERGLKVILTASNDPEEMAYNARVRHLISHENLIDLSGKISLKELGALIEGADLLFCVDSVPLHIASATKTPVVALFGPTSEVRWSPWRHLRAKTVFQSMPCRPCYRPGCVDSHQSDCLLTLRVGDIIEAIRSIE